MFPLPKITIPAFRTALTTSASRDGLALTNAMLPHAVDVASRVGMLSFSRMGMPWRRPRGPFERRSASRCWAVDVASGFTSATAWNVGFVSRILVRQADVRSTAVKRRF